MSRRQQKHEKLPSMQRQIQVIIGEFRPQTDQRSDDSIL